MGDCKNGLFDCFVIDCVSPYPRRGGGGAGAVFVIHSRLMIEYLQTDRLQNSAAVFVCSSSINSWFWIRVFFRCVRCLIRSVSQMDGWEEGMEGWLGCRMWTSMPEAEGGVFTININSCARDRALSEGPPSKRGKQAASFSIRHLQ